MGRPIAIDLFAGAGGMSLGFEQAGFDVRAAVEIDPVHCAVHKFNFPDCAVIPKSIVAVNAAEIRAASGIGEKRVDCVFGGPPCQGFSMIGHRSFDDPRNSLVLEFVRLVAELDATAFVFENVKGLTVGRHKAFLHELGEAFGRAGYELRLPWRVLDAARYGVPQHRERLFIMGVKKGAEPPAYPEPTVRPADELDTLFDLPFGPTCADALGDLPDAEMFEELIEDDAVRFKVMGAPSQYATVLRGLSNDAWFYGFQREWNPALMTSSFRTAHSTISKRRFGETGQGEVEPISRFYKLSPRGLSNTLRAGTDGARGAFTSPRPIHYLYPRCVTVREMARLHGFPDWFRFHKTKWHGARQIGNSVPPPLARAVAAQVIAAIGAQPKRPRRSLMLGDVALLEMEAREAARHFDVPPPIGRRDKKSGAKKRKQSEIERLRIAGMSDARVRHG